MAWCNSWNTVSWRARSWLMSATVEGVGALAPVGAGSGRARMRNQRPRAAREEAWRAVGPTGTGEEAWRAVGPTGTGEEPWRAAGPAGTGEEPWRAAGPAGTGEAPR